MPSSPRGEEERIKMSGGGSAQQSLLVRFTISSLLDGLKSVLDTMYPGEESIS